MTGKEYLDLIRDVPPELEFVSHHSIETVIKYMTAWSMASIVFNEPQRPIPERYEDRMRWLWSETEINFTKLNQLFGENPQHGFMQRMIEAGLIFPDGTYSVPGMERLKILQALKDKGDK